MSHNESSPVIPVQTTFRHMQASAAVTDCVAREAQKLRRYFARITHCHVVIIESHKHHGAGRQYAFHVELGVPHGPLAVTHEASGRSLHPDAAHEDIYLTLRDTFEIVRRRLEAHAQRLRGEVKRHEAPASDHA